MALRYRTVVALTLALVALPAASSARAHRSAPPAPHHRPPALTIDQIYSKSALRRAKIIVELKLLELKRERLDRVRKALMKNQPIEDLLKVP